MTKMLEVKKTRKFGGKTYRLYKYEPMRSEANKLAETLRKRGTSARVVAQPGYGGGGWNIYIRGR